MTTTNCIHWHLWINVTGIPVQNIRGNAQSNAVFAGNKNMKTEKKKTEKLKRKPERKMPERNIQKFL